MVPVTASVHDLSKVEIRTIDNLEDAFDFQHWLGQRRDVLAFDIETTGLTFWKDKIRLIQFGDWDTGWVIDYDRWKGLATDALLKYEGDIVGHNVSFDYRFITHDLGLDPRRWEWARIHDTQTMGYLTDPLASKALKSMAARYVSARAVSGQQALDDDMSRGGWNWETVPIDLPSYVFYSGLDTVITARLMAAVYPDVSAKYLTAYELEMQLEGVLFRMMMHGMLIDPDYCRTKRAELLSRADELLMGMQEYGIDSPNQRVKLINFFLSEGVELTELTDTGQIKLDKDVLETIDHPLAKAVVEYRNVTKWASTYFDNFLLSVNPATGRLYPEIRQYQAKTGRMSVTNPAMQTLPRGPLVRDAIIAPEGSKLISSDFSSVEARIFAHFANEDGMIRAIKDGLDFHTYTAQQAFNLGDALPTKEQRQIAKNTTFCVPTTTKIVTRRGIVLHNELLPTDETLGLNAETETLEWTPILLTHHFEDSELIRFGNTRRSYVCTPDHGWVAKRRSNGKIYRTTAQSFNSSNDRILLCAPLPGEGSDEDGWLLGMLLGDGHIRWRPGNGVEAVITQCKPNFLPRLRDNENTNPETPHGVECFRYSVKASWIRKMYKRLGVSDPVHLKYVDLLPAILAQPNDFIRGVYEGFYAAEGSQQPDESSWYQDDGHTYRTMLVVSAIASGQSPRTYWGNGGRPYAARVSMTRPHLQYNIERNPVGRGPSWCVTTGNGSWLAVDEDGQVFLTGNCLVYGGGPKKIAQTAGISLDDAYAFVSRYEQAFPGFRRFQREVQDGAKRRWREEGSCYIETHLGSRLAVGDPDDAYKLTNYAIQGSARLALADRMVALDSAGVMDYALLAVHDEVVFEVPDSETEEVRQIVADVMPDNHTFAVPLAVDVSEAGDRWGSIK